MVDGTLKEAYNCLHYQYFLLFLVVILDSFQEYKAMLEEAKKYDHRELTKKQELFFFHPLRYKFEVHDIFCS